VSTQDLGGTPEDRAEQATPVVRDAETDVQVPLEAVDADVVEQAADAGASQGPAAAELPLEADPADAAEQAAVVDLDEDEHR